MASIYKRLSSNNEAGGVASSVIVTQSALPFGAATSANQTTEINLLTSIGSKIDDSNTLLAMINSNLGGGSDSFVFNEVTGVPSATLTTIVSHIASGTEKLVSVDVSGTNIAAYTVVVNGFTVDKAYTNFGASLSHSFDFNRGYNLTMGDTVLIKVEHNRPYTGNFNGKIITGVN